MINDRKVFPGKLHLFTLRSGNSFFYAIKKEVDTLLHPLMGTSLQSNAAPDVNDYGKKRTTKIEILPPL